MHHGIVLIARKDIPSSWIIPDDLVVYPSAKATMCEALFKQYIDEHLIASFNGSAGMLLMDEFAAHQTAEIIKYLMENGICPLFIPGGTTSIFQPLDVAVNFPFKHEYERLWNTWFDTEDKNEDEIVYTKQCGNRKVADWSLILKWISESLKIVRKETIKRSFECCGLLAGDWLSFEHLNDALKKLLKPVPEDWDKESEILDELNLEIRSSFEKNLINATAVIEFCSQENYAGDTLPPKPKRTYTKRTQK